MIGDTGKLKDTALFSGLTETEISQFLNESGAFVQNYSKGESVCDVGDEARNLGLVISGRLASKSFVQGDHSLILKTYESYEPIGLDTLYSRKKTYPRDIVAQRKSSVLWISYERLRNFGKPNSRISNILKDNMDALIAGGLIRSDYKSEILANNRVTQRLLVYLEIVAAKQDGLKAEINMTQTELADYLCVSRPALTRAIAELRKQGKIETDGKNIKMIRNEIK